MLNRSINPKDRATIPGQSEPESDENEGIICIPQSSSITEISPSDCFVISRKLVGESYASEESYSSAEMQSVHSAAPATRAFLRKEFSYYYMLIHSDQFSSFSGSQFLHIQCYSKNNS